jgi:formylglycine-generating enzyme required for sulfatase activity
MNRLALLWMLIIGVMGFAATTLVPAQEPPAKAPARRVSLLVGINEYRKRGFVDRKWAENDVDEMAQELRRLDFDKVVTMKGSSQGELRPTKEHIETQLKRLLADVGKDDIVLVMLSGHGQDLEVKVRAPDGRETEREDGFYCPVNAVLNEPDTMVSLSDLTDDLLARRGGKNLVLLDACRDGIVDLDKGVRARGVQGRVVSLPENTAMLFSCESRQTSIERDELRHGVFAYSVLESLRAEADGGAVTWDALVDRVRYRVAELNPDQDPISAGVIPRLVLGRRRTSPDSITTRVARIRLKLIPAGTFRMGSPAEDKDAEADEGPQHVVRIGAFFLGVTEVTRGQFRRFVDETGYKTEAEKDGEGGWGWNQEKRVFEPDAIYTWLTPGFEQTDEHPVVNVSWNDAVAFCEWLSRVEGQTYRLPTEAEWEYACRARTETKYFSGSDPESLATVGNIADATGRTKYPDWPGAIGARDGFVYTAPAGQFRPNAFGLYDMHGNVWEWCRDGYDPEYYERSPEEDPSGSSQAVERVIRGGCWDDDPRECRSASRSRDAPNSRNDLLGFRVARVQSPR